MFILSVKPRAIKMLKEAYTWYEEQRTGLGERLLIEIDKCYNKLEREPELYAKIKQNFRQISLRTFPYVLVFSIEEKEVVVYAVFHTSRSPKKKFFKQ